jgi:uncharacterized protein (TIGR02145 family)
MKQLFATLAVITIVMLACKKDKKPPTVPTLTTTAVTNLSGSTAQSGGAITSDGGATITASGIAWSKINNPPTITDDTTKGTVSNGTFAAMLKNLEPSATYYVRAYATNSAGTGYGNVVTFNTSNGAPQAKNISFVGTAAVTNKIKVTYTYFDFENDPKATAGYQWYLATDTSGGATGTAISGAIDSIYTIVAGDQSKFLRVAITPKSSGGTSPGTSTNSWWIGPVAAEPTSVTFSYNGANVTYGIIISPTTNKRWLDRNLGATRVATSATDYLAYGDLFQWGRPADGHQLMTWTSSTTGAPVNGTTTTKATSNIPGHNQFIGGLISDWQNVSDYNNRWVTNPQGPCPFSWHVPSKDEWKAEVGNSAIKDDVTGYNILKLTKSGDRDNRTGGLEAGTGGEFGFYWASTLYNPNSIYFLDIEPGYASATTGIGSAALGYTVRCIKD